MAQGVPRIVDQHTEVLSHAAALKLQCLILTEREFMSCQLHSKSFGSALFL